MLHYVQIICESTLFVQQILLTDYGEVDYWSLTTNTLNLT